MNIKYETYYQLKPGVVIFADGHEEECEVVSPHDDMHIEFS